MTHDPIPVSLEPVTPPTVEERASMHGVATAFINDQFALLSGLNPIDRMVACYVAGAKAEASYLAHQSTRHTASETAGAVSQAALIERLRNGAAAYRAGKVFRDTMEFMAAKATANTLEEAADALEQIEASTRTDERRKVVAEGGMKSLWRPIYELEWRYYTSHTHDGGAR